MQQLVHVRVVDRGGVLERGAHARAEAEQHGVVGQGAAGLEVDEVGLGLDPGEGRTGSSRAAMPASRSSIQPKLSPASAARLVKGVSPRPPGRYRQLRASGLYTELQCGSYIFMDADYGRNRDRDGEPFTTFEPSLFVWGR